MTHGSVHEDGQADATAYTLGEGHLLFFADSASLSRIEDALAGDLKAHGFVVEKASDEALCVLPEQSALESEATRAQLLKPVAAELSGNSAGAFERFDHEARALYEGVDSLDFFTGGEINRMAHRIMYFNIKVRSASSIARAYQLELFFRELSQTHMRIQLAHDSVAHRPSCRCLRSRLGCLLRVRVRVFAAHTHIRR